MNFLETASFDDPVVISVLIGAVTILGALIFLLCKKNRKPHACSEKPEEAQLQTQDSVDPGSHQPNVHDTESVVDDDSCCTLSNQTPNARFESVRRRLKKLHDTVRQIHQVLAEKPALVEDQAESAPTESLETVKSDLAELGERIEKLEAENACLSGQKDETHQQLLIIQSELHKCQNDSILQESQWSAKRIELTAATERLQSESEALKKQLKDLTEKIENKDEQIKILKEKRIKDDETLRLKLIELVPINEKQEYQKLVGDRFFVKFIDCQKRLAQLKADTEQSGAALNVKLNTVNQELIKEKEKTQQALRSVKDKEKEIQLRETAKLQLEKQIVELNAKLSETTKKFQVQQKNFKEVEADFNIQRAELVQQLDEFKVALMNMQLIRSK